MPIEIRELLIKVTVLDDAPARAVPPAPPAALAGEALRQFQQDLTQTCVRQVLAELQRRRER
ncbi:DUF5908 family protein [Hymenobacter cheonanensis]|uniref:DUF5908 family protein n=1 Tax=Hymenobacter sp. CA2-7 TaxID=3063993 RepID=UPI0027139EBB|nr:DUF5908 family protein [Hymenobacter sp. CA2-7]MDO7883967.1 DUF5908 family protein [Hymenobacter sp. CA2-7]